MGAWQQAMRSEGTGRKDGTYGIFSQEVQLWL